MKTKLKCWTWTERDQDRKLWTKTLGNGKAAERTWELRISRVNVTAEDESLIILKDRIEFIRDDLNRHQRWLTNWASSVNRAICQPVYKLDKISKKLRIFFKFCYLHHSFPLLFSDFKKWKEDSIPLFFPICAYLFRIFASQKNEIQKWKTWRRAYPIRIVF